jgi:hypothetical protein
MKSIPNFRASLFSIIAFARIASSSPLGAKLQIRAPETKYFIYIQQRECDGVIVPDGCQNEKVMPDEGRPLAYLNDTIAVFPGWDPAPEVLQWTIEPRSKGYFALLTRGFEAALAGNDEFLYFQPSNTTGDVPNHQGEYKWASNEEGKYILFGNATKSQWIASMLDLPDGREFWHVRWNNLNESKFMLLRLERSVLMRLIAEQPYIGKHFAINMYIQSTV